MTRSARELTIRSARWAKAGGVDTILRRGAPMPPRPDIGPTRRSAQAGISPRIHRSSLPPRRVAGALSPRLSSARTEEAIPEPKPVPVVHSASSRARGEDRNGVFTPHLARDGTTSQPCLGSGGSVHVATQRACRPVAGTRCVRRAHLPLRPVVLIAGAIARPSNNVVPPGSGSAVPEAGRPN
jgi:hypothetical protein